MVNAARWKVNDDKKKPHRTASLLLKIGKDLGSGRFAARNDKKCDI